MSCAVEGCDRVVFARGWCQRHYRAWHTHGSELYVPPQRPTTCSVPGCSRPPNSRGMCFMHYSRVVRHGNPEVSKNLRGVAPEIRFWRLVERWDPDECWLWSGGRNNHGYGRFEQGYAHRFAYTSLLGDIPKGLELDHLCRVPACVNPKHLEPVTHRENVLRGNVASSRRGAFNGRKKVA